MRKALALFVLFVAVLQIAVSWQRFDWPFYLNPHFGITACFAPVCGEGSFVYKYGSYLSAFILGIFGWWMLISERGLPAYLMIEPILAAPSVLFMFFIFHGDVRPSDGFSHAELATLVVVFCVTSVLPWCFGVWLDWRQMQAKSKLQT